MLTKPLLDDFNQFYTQLFETTSGQVKMSKRAF
jgi:hypothetical protein